MQWSRLFECIVKNLGKAIQKRPAPSPKTACIVAGMK